MARLTQRILYLLRVMHAGVPVRVAPKGTGVLDMSRMPRHVAPEQLAALEADGLIARTARRTHYEITEKGRDAVRVRDDVDPLVDEASSLTPRA